MINAWWLLIIVPVSLLYGFLIGSETMDEHYQKQLR